MVVHAMRTRSATASIRAQVLDGDLLHLIFNKLSPHDLAVARCVSKVWNKTALEVERTHYLSHWPSYKGMMDYVHGCYKLFGKLANESNSPVSHLLFCIVRNGSNLLLVPNMWCPALNPALCKQIKSGGYCLTLHEPPGGCGHAVVDASCAVADSTTFELFLLTRWDGRLARTRGIRTVPDLRREAGHAHGLVTWTVTWPHSVATCMATIDTDMILQLGVLSAALNYTDASCLDRDYCEHGGDLLLP
eukprot:jgi/Chlat1/8143/Chrsp75S09200